MEFKDLVLKRYSCRKFLPYPVEEEKILKCIEAARFAPSACNVQPWKFIIVNESNLKQKLTKVATSGIYKFSKFIQEAPVIIVVLADKGSFLSKMGSFIRNNNFYLIDIGIACEHIVLQATELGLGSCYVGWFNERHVKKLLKIPSKYKVPLLICLGYPQQDYKDKDLARKISKSDFRKDLEDIVSFNGFY